VLVLAAEFTNHACTASAISGEDNSKAQGCGCVNAFKVPLTAMLQTWHSAASLTGGGAVNSCQQHQRAYRAAVALGQPGLERSVLGATLIPTA
jgi:hypothetical protein